jgi:hypothetical protein
LLKQLPCSPGSFFPTHTSTCTTTVSSRSCTTTRNLSHRSRYLHSENQTRSVHDMRLKATLLFPLFAWHPHGVIISFTGVSSIGAAPLSHSAVYPSTKHWAQRLLYFGWKHGVGKHPSKALALWEGFMGREFFTTSVLPAWGLPGCMTFKRRRVVDYSYYYIIHSCIGFASCLRIPQMDCW